MSILTERLPATTTRVEQNTAPEVREQIDRRMDRQVARYQGASPEAISERLQELDREWDIERTLEANAATVILLSTLLGFTVSKRWFALTGVAAAFLLQHALQGWCPPVVPWRHAGVRTESEIQAEKTALRLLRGDFRPTASASEAVAQATGS